MKTVHLIMREIVIFVSETLVASKAGEYTVSFLSFFFCLVYPAGGALPSRAVLRGWNGGAHPTLRFP